MDYLLDIAKVHNAQSLKCCERVRPIERKFDPALAVFQLQNSNFKNNHICLFSMRPSFPPSRCLPPIRELRRHRSFSHWVCRSSWNTSPRTRRSSDRTPHARLLSEDCLHPPPHLCASNGNGHHHRDPTHRFDVTSLVAINTRNLKGLVTGVVHRLWSFSLLDPGQCLNFHFPWNFVFLPFCVWGRTKHVPLQSLRH